MVGKEKKRSKYILAAVGVIVGVVCGFLIARVLGHATDSGTGYYLRCLLLFLGMLISLWFQIIFHEAGHLIFGLLTGYKFSSFRVGSTMLLKDGDKLRIKKLKIAGTGGQCLMVPPDMVNGTFPVTLYNLGGPIMNVITAIVCIVLYFLCRKSLPQFAVVLMMAAMIGICLALLNGIPMRMGTVDNDGYNTLALNRDGSALRSFWIQMKTNELLSRGVRLKDMPSDWFVPPDEAGMQNSMTAVLGVFACNRLMDEQRFQEADALMEQFLETDTAIVGLHRSLMICDRIYCELIGQNRPERVDAFLSQEQRNYMKSMKNFPTVIRTEYAYARLRDKDIWNASLLKDRFEQCAVRYPYPADIEAERELIYIVDDIAENAAVNIL